MDKNEPFVFVHSEEDGETLKQSPGSNHTWPMDKLRQTRYKETVLSLLSPVTPKKNYSARHVKSLLLQCLLDSRSESHAPRRFPISYSDDGLMMDGVLVTSETGQKFSGSPSSSLGRSPRSSTTRSQHKNTEFSSPKCESGRKQGTPRSQQSSAEKGKMLANSPSTKVETPNSPSTTVETPKAANSSKLKANAKPFIRTPRSSERLPSPVPFQQLPYNHEPHFPWGHNPPPPLQLPYPPPGFAFPRPLQMPFHPYLHLSPSPHYLPRFPRPPPGYQMAHDLNQSPIKTSLSTTPSSSQPNKNTSKPSVHTPTSTHPTAQLSTSETIQGSRLDLPSSVDGLGTVTPKGDLSSPSDELETKTQKKPDMSSSAGFQTVKTEKDWSPSDDGLETFSQAQSDFTKSNDRILPDDVFQHYKYRKRLPDLVKRSSEELPQLEPQEDQ